MRTRSKFYRYGKRRFRSRRRGRRRVAKLIRRYRVSRGGIRL